MFFVHVWHLTLCPFGCPLGPHPGSWLTKWGPDGTAQISKPSCWMFVLLAKYSILRPSGCSLEAHAARMEQQCEKRVSRKKPGPRNIITCYSLKTSPNPSYSLPEGATVGASFQYSNPNENMTKSWPPWTINPSSIFRASGLFLGTAFWHPSAETRSFLPDRTS